MGPRRGAPVSLIEPPHEPHGPREGKPGRPRLGRDPPRYRPVLLPGNEFLQPLTMMSPGPTAAHAAAGHGRDRTANPDRRIDVDDPDANDTDCRARMDQHGDPLLSDGG